VSSGRLGLCAFLSLFRSFGTPLGGSPVSEFFFPAAGDANREAQDEYVSTCND